MIKRQFDYEQKHRQLLDKIEELKALSQSTQIDLSPQIALLESSLQDLREEKYRNLAPFEKTLLVRHPERPTSRQYIEFLCDDWLELHGDRLYGEDPAIIGGIGLIDGQAVTVLGHQKGQDTSDNVKHNFGMPHPEGYRKVLRLLLEAKKFHRPVITFVDTPGAYPGIGAEQRGQAWAISQVLMTLSHLPVPVIAIVTGEGGSGGALALAVADRLLMLSNAVFSVASPEACASILWKDLDRAEEMASALKITAADLYKLGIIDGIIEEPPGGAHQDFTALASEIKKALKGGLQELLALDQEELIRKRFLKLDL